MNQVLLNLCVNAIHAIGTKKEGLIQITGKIVARETIETHFHTKVAQTWDQFIEVQIQDNGCGMDAGTMEQIFNPFFTTNMGKQGTGLGLSIVEQIVHSHSGYIFAESTVGEGSVFSIYLPLVEKDLLVEEKMAVKEDMDILKIMVIDDNGKVLRLLEKGFTKLGITMVGVENTHEARSLLQKELFDVVLIDQSLSKASSSDTGVLFAMSINQLYPDVIKIIMTEQVRKEIIEAKQHGIINDYIEKPVSCAKIIEVIRSMQ